MNSERTQAYGRVVKTLEDLGPTKLQPAEQSRVREAADTLIFAAELDEARLAMADVDVLAEHLVASDRWSEERVRRRTPGDEGGGASDFGESPSGSPVLSGSV